MMKAFSLHGATVSQNEYDSAHWAKRHKWRDQWFEEVMAALSAQNWPSMPSPVRFTICRVGKRLIDPQNVAGPTKPILDAFVFYKCLEGDSAKDITLFSTTQRKCQKGESPHMEILISPGQLHAVDSTDPLHTNNK